jgi:O-acetyl-ADP-ribose deacetylase (regulator of RNase III)
MPFEIKRSDITKMSVDAIVCPANPSSPQVTAGVCGAIFRAAGADKLREVCRNLRPTKTGEAVITQGFNLPARYIIHMAEPEYHEGKRGDALLLRSCYLNALDLAKKNGCKSIAFPSNSGDVQRYPREVIDAVAKSVIGDWLMENDMDVYFVVFEGEGFAWTRRLYGEIKQELTTLRIHTGRGGCLLEFPKDSCYAGKMLSLRGEMCVGRPDEHFAVWGECMSWLTYDEERDIYCEHPVDESESMKFELMDYIIAEGRKRGFFFAFYRSY